MKMPKRESEEEILKKVMNMGSGKVENKDDKEAEEAGEAEEEVKGVELEQPSANVMPHVQRETGLKSEEDNKGNKKDDAVDTTDIDSGNADGTTSKTTSSKAKDILTVSNAQKRIHDAQTKMHTATSEKAEADALLDTANLKVKSYEAIIAKSGVNSTEGIQAQQNINDTHLQTVADMQALEKEYPEIAKPLITAFNKIQGQLDSMKKKQTASTESMQESNEKILDDIHFKQISDSHSDYAIINKSQEFTDWINGLSPFERSAALMVKANGNADESISMLDKFKDDTGYGGSGNENDNTNTNDNTNKVNLDIAKSKVSPSFNKSKAVKLTDNKKQLTMADMRNMAPTKENEDRILQAMASGNLI